MSANYVSPRVSNAKRSSVTAPTMSTLIKQRSSISPVKRTKKSSPTKFANQTKKLKSPLKASNFSLRSCASKANVRA